MEEKIKHDIKTYLQYTPHNYETIRKYYRSQRDKKLPKLLQSNICGISCLYTAVKYILDSKINLSFFECIEKYIETNSFNKVAYGVKTKVRKNIIVPVQYYHKDMDVRAEAMREMKKFTDFPKLIRVDDEENPMVIAFSIRNGFDYRGLDTFFTNNNLNLNHEYFGDETVYPVLERFIHLRKLKKKPVILMSVYLQDLSHVVGKDGVGPLELNTHIILIYDMRVLEDKVILYYSDPNHTNFEDGIRVISLKSLQRCFYNRAAIIYET